MLWLFEGAEAATAGSETWLQRYICKDLNALAKNHKFTYRTIWSATIFAHEASHIYYPEGNERVTECRALRLVPWLIKRLGGNTKQIFLTKQIAWMLARDYLPSAYQSRCTNTHPLKPPGVTRLPS
jgi:hypothetical protein